MPGNLPLPPVLGDKTSSTQPSKTIRSRRHHEPPCLISPDPLSLYPSKYSFLLHLKYKEKRYSSLVVKKIFFFSLSSGSFSRRDFDGERDIKLERRKERKGKEGSKIWERMGVESRGLEASLVPVGIARFCYGEFCHGGRDPTCKHPCGQELRFGIRRR